AQDLMTITVPFLSSSIPAADHAALAGLSDDAVRAWVTTRAQEYHDIAAALFSIYNAVAPIHRAFPTEILSEIFSHCWKDPRSIAVIHVCRHWRSIALKTPSLWTAALAAPGKLLGSQRRRCRSSRRDFAEFALARSSPQPLRLKIYHFFDHFASTLAPHAARLVDLYVRLVDVSNLSTLCRFLNSGAPNLEVLGITFP
ncbi:uncharacterized protein BXZ73DRAFT_33698, partial [Epithele typhae]|uniref:uncharacterized protein n=1 Tax=Epithele typhae TaxID=378194 RepID=UPI00200724AE